MIKDGKLKKLYSMINNDDQKGSGGFNGQCIEKDVKKIIHMMAKVKNDDRQRVINLYNNFEFTVYITLRICVPLAHLKVLHLILLPI